jgi:WD40 repeat protein
MTTDVNKNPQEDTKGEEGGSVDYQFDVFLSYSRRDEEFVSRLEEALKNYKLPKAVKASLSSKSRLSVFRDKKDFVPTDGDYYKTIEGYLKRSAYLVVICSPNAHRSAYVNQEITTFLKFHESKRLIPVLLSGRPNNEDGTEPNEYAFPKALCDALAMPLAVEFTEFQRVRGKLNKGRYYDSWYTLLAKIFGVERAEIERLDAKRRARSRATFVTVSVAVIALLSVALIFADISRREALKQRQESINQRDHARRLLYASDMNLAQRAFVSSNVGMGMRLLEAYQPTNQSGQEDFRGFEWYYLWRLYNSQIATFNGAGDIAFSRDGKLFTIATTDELKIYDTASLRETASFKLKHPQSVTNGSETTHYSSQAMDFSPDGRTLAYSGEQRMLLLHIDSGSLREVPASGKEQEHEELKGREKLTEKWYKDFVEGEGTPRFSPDGKLLAVSYMCGEVTVYDAYSLKPIASLGDGPPPTDYGCADFVLFSPDGRILAYGNEGSATFWDTVAHRDLGELEIGTALPDIVGLVESIAFSPDSKILAIGDRSKQVVLWNISTRKILARLDGHGGWVFALAFSPDGKILYSGSMDHTVKLWDFSSYKGDGRVSGEKIKVFATIKGHTSLINSITCSPAGGVIATVGRDRTIKLWNEDAGRDFDALNNVETIYPGANIIAQNAHDGTRKAVTFSDLRGGELTELWTVDRSMNATISPDGKTLVTKTPLPGKGVSTIKLWDVSSRQELITLQAQTYVYSPDFSSNGRLFITISPDGNSLLLWDTAERKELTLISNDAKVDGYLLSDDGKVVVTVNNSGLLVKSWDRASRKQLAMFRLKGEPVSEIEVEHRLTRRILSPDGKFLAFTGTYSAEVQLWETDSTQDSVLLGKHEGYVSVLTFSPDGKLLATGDWDGVVKVWDTSTSGELYRFQGHRDSVTAIAFSIDGRTLASGGRDGTVKLYSIASMRELITLTHEPSPTSDINAIESTEDTVQELMFSADGRSLITLSTNNVLRIWRGTNEANIAASGQ